MTDKEMPDKEQSLIMWFDDIGRDDGNLVGGKNASLGEMIRSLGESGVRVPSGFAVTADAYRRFLGHNELNDRIRETLEGLSPNEVGDVGKSIRRDIRGGEVPPELRDAIEEAYHRLCERSETNEVPVAVRSSATAEDLPEASFAGQLETYLNVRGIDAVVDHVRLCFASLFTDRAISYRQEHEFDHLKVAVSVGVQRMVRADTGAAGVMFTIDTDTGFPDIVLINGSWGLGEYVVQGSVDPDEFRVFKPLLDQAGARPIIGRTLGGKARRLVYNKSNQNEPTRGENTPKDLRTRFVLDDDQVLTLARWAQRIEQHYERPMDIEWALDGETKELHIVQARPETVHSQKGAATMHSYKLHEDAEPVATGVAIGQAIAAGPARRLTSPEDPGEFQDGDILVTERTDPDWVPLMRRAGAVVTDLGGRTSHAAIVSRELGVPAVVGSGDATEILHDGDEYTVDCASGDTGRILEGRRQFEQQEIDLADVPETKTDIMMNIASPAAAARWWRLPNHGVGLARLEFLIGNTIGVHPLALVRPGDIDKKTAKAIRDRARGYDEPVDWFVDTLAFGIATIAATAHPHPCIVRLSDFKTNEYAELLGGECFEPDESNPMLGLRGASRYYSDRYRDGFALECRAIRKVRDEIGLRNVVLMVPFCRTLEEADRVLGVMAEHGLTRGEGGLEVYVMCEIPSNVVLATEFSDRFDGFSIGTNDLAQMVLGVDRDSAELAHLYDEQNEGVKVMIRQVIEKSHQKGRKVGLCGQAPSDHPEFAAFLVEAGIDSISVIPDSVLPVCRVIAQAEQNQKQTTTPGREEPS